MLGAADPPAAMLAGHQPALAIDGIAIGVVGGAPENRDLAVAFVVAQHAIVGNVRPEKIAPGGEIGRSFGPTAACIEAMQMGGGTEQALKALIQNLEFSGHDDVLLSPMPAMGRAFAPFAPGRSRLFHERFSRIP
jgi:hypothetical protein